jgi:uncharacterized membrane protein YhiD involved in acid resistance
LAVIRFRTPIRDPRDMIFLFICLATGIACGAATYLVAIIGSFFMGAAALFLHYSPFASRRNFEGLLRFTAPAERKLQEQAEQCIEMYCRDSSIVALREAAQGDLYEYAYHVRLQDPSYRVDLVEALRGVSGLVDPTLLMHRTTVEL